MHRWEKQLPPADMTDCAEARVVRADKRLQGLISGCLNAGRKRRDSGEWKHRVRGPTLATVSNHEPT